MEYLSWLFILLARFLILIGDSVIFVFRGVYILIKKIIKKITDGIIGFLLLFKRISTKAVAPKPFSSSSPKVLKPVKRKKPKSLGLFPMPFLSKLKYFTSGVVFSLIFVFIPLLVVIFLQDLPNPKEISLGQLPQTTKIYDRNGTLLYQIYATQNRTVIPLSDIPKNLQEATIAIEDKDFYNHPGFDIVAILRSAVADLSGRDFQGGSTITQQLIKSVLLTPETTFSRKIKELILAFWAERMYTKNEILQLYFNSIAYGGTAYGAEAASEVYFGKSVKYLDLAESAFLAGMPKAPTVYSPFGSTPTLWKGRQKEVLSRMYQLGYITQEQEQSAEAEQLTFQTPQTPLYAPHFVMYIKDLLVEKYGLETVEKGGLTVRTTLDLNIQDQAQKIVSDEVSQDGRFNLTNGAAVITDPRNGDLLAMIGSKDFDDPNGGNVNVTTSLRPPGSSIKIVTYSAALSRGYTAATILNDSPVTFGPPPYSPVNYDGKFHGNVPLRIALANSLNIPAVKTLNQIGIPLFLDFAKKMGIQSFNDNGQYGLSITLGGADVTMLDMATAFGTLANEGARVDINPILKITDYKGDVIEEKQPNPQQVLDPGVPYILSSILSDNNARSMEFGPNSPLNIPGHTVSVKTGTSDDKRDNWTIGYTPFAVVAVWVGNNDNSPMSQALASGITGAAPIWNKLMSLILSESPGNEKFQVPSDIISESCLGHIEYFIRGTENSVSCAPPPPPTPTPTP